MATWSLVSMICNNTFSNFSIVLRVFLIKHNEEQIETRQKRIGKSNISANWLISGIFSIDWIGSCNDRTTSV
jgi:hypothetical protein